MVLLEDQAIPEEALCDRQRARGGQLDTEGSPQLASTVERQSDHRDGADAADRPMQLVDGLVRQHGVIGIDLPAVNAPVLDTKLHRSESETTIIRNGYICSTPTMR